MGKNVNGGKKQKKRKQVRNNVVEVRKVKNIARPLPKEYTYYGKVLKTYGSKFDVNIFYKDKNNNNIIKKIDAKIRGSRQMKYKCPRVSVNKNPYVIVEYNKEIYKFGTIIWVYKEWEYKYLLESKIIITTEKDDEDFYGFKFSTDKLDNKEDNDECETNNKLNNTNYINKDIEKNIEKDIEKDIEKNIEKDIEKNIEKELLKINIDDI